MKIGRNDPCPCGSGKKYKKCCLGKEAGAEPESISHHGSQDSEEKEPFEWETLANMYNRFRSYELKKKPHIKEYKQIRKMHGEIIDSMVDYYQNDNFEQKVDPAYKPDVAPTRKNRREAATLYLHELDFDMESDRSVHAFYDMLIYKAAPNLSCITEDYISSHRFRKPEKIEMLQSMLDSRLGLFEVIGRDSKEGYAQIRDVLNAAEYTLTDMGLSNDMNSDDLLIYTRIITYRGVSFGTGLSLTFSKNDSFVKSFIKRHKANYHAFGEYGRFAELYKHFCASPEKTKIIANKF